MFHHTFNAKLLNTTFSNTFQCVYECVCVCVYTASLTSRDLCVNEKAAGVTPPKPAQGERE